MVSTFDLLGKVDDSQARDKETGLRVWTVRVVDIEQPDESVRFLKSSELKVRVASEQRPVPPPSRVPGYPPLVAFEGLTLTPYLDAQKCLGPRRGEAHKCRARVAYSLRATGMVEFVDESSTAA